MDQLIFSFSNVALLLVTARELSIGDFGAFALVLTAGLVTINVIRGLTSETLAVRYAGPDVTARQWGASASSGAALAISVLASVVLMTIGLVVGGLAGASLLALAAALPGVTVQDSLRYAALTAERPGAAIANDALQATVQFAAMAALIATDQREPWQFVSAWGLGSYVAAAMAGLSLGTCPAPLQTRRWFRLQGDLASRYGLDNLIMAGSQNAGTITLGLVAPVSAIGALRGTQTLFTPPSVLSAGVRSAVTPEIVRGMQRERSTLRRDVRLLALGLGAVSLAWGVVVLLIPDELGRQLLGPTWGAVGPLLPYFAVAQVANGLWIGPMVGLRALGAGNRTIAARAIANVFVIGGQALGAVLGGALGVAVATALVRPVQLGIWWYHYARAAREHAAVTDAVRMGDMASPTQGRKP